MASNLLKRVKLNNCWLEKMRIQMTTLRSTVLQTPSLQSLFYTNFSSSKFRDKEQPVKQTLKESAGRRSPLRAPEWLRNLHADLMKSVTLPAHSKGMQDGINKQIDVLNVTPSQFLTIASFLQINNPDQDKLVFTLCRNLDNMSIEEILTAADIMYKNNVVSHVYKKAMIAYFYEIIESLHFTPPQIVRTVFHFQDVWPFATKLMIELEEKISQCLSDLTLNQVAQICHLLFYGQYRFKSMTLVDSIGKKVLQEFDSLSPDYLPMMMKAFRYSNYIKVSFYKELGDKIVSNDLLNNFSNAGQVMHFAFTYASVRVTHQKLFNHLLKRVLKLKKTPRIKDLSKLIWACGTLVTTDKEQLEMIDALVDTVRENITIEQVLRYPDNLVDFLVGLAYLNIYPVDLIEQFMGEDTIKLLMGIDSSRIKFPQLQFLDESLAIECPNYNRRLLTKMQRQEVKSQVIHLNEDVDKMLRKPLIPAFEALKDLIGEENVHCGFVLPHFKTADILLRFDQQSEQFISLQSTEDKLNPDKVARVVVMLLSRPQTSFDDQPLGMLHCKIRQLSRLGYKLVQINADEAMSYTFLDRTKIQQKILAHVSEALGHPAKIF